MNSLISQFVTVWIHPWDAMNHVKQQPANTSLLPSVIFVLVMSIISGIIITVAAVISPPPELLDAPKWMTYATLVTIPLGYVLGSFITAFFIWWVVDGILFSTSDKYKTSYRALAPVAAFSPVSTGVAFIPVAGPWIAIAISLWSIYVTIKGIIIVRDTPPRRTWISFILLFVAFIIMSVFARVAIEREMIARGEAGFTGLGAPADDLGSASDDFDQELQNLADRTKANQKAPAATDKK